MAQSGRNVEMAAGAGITFQNSSAYKAGFTNTSSSSSTPPSAIDNVAAKSTGSTTMPGAASGKIGVGNADRGGMPNLMSIYQPPAAGSMPAKNTSAPKVAPPSNPSTSRMSGFRMGGMIGWGGGYGGIGMSRLD